MSSTQHFGRIIRDKRTAKSWSISYTAELCGICEKSLAQIELGDTDPKLSTVLKISVVLKLDLGELESCKPEMKELTLV